MNKTVVSIPNVTEEVRIGSSFNYVLMVIKETEASVCASWDFSNVTFLHPFFLASLAIYKNTTKKQIECVNIPPRIQSYLDIIRFNHILHFNQEPKEHVETIMQNYTNKRYLPLCSFAMTNTNKDVFGSIIKSILMKQAGISASGSSSLSYLISELLDNVYEHSHSPNGYVFSQYSKKEKVIDLCIADSGQTIAGSFRNSGRYQEEIDGNEAEALKLANEGYSTKNRPEAENRGYGISTSKSMLVSGMKGAFFMLSGSAFHRYENGDNIYINLGNLFHWNGTIILLRIPVVLPVGFNYTDYLE